MHNSLRFVNDTTLIISGFRALGLRFVIADSRTTNQRISLLKRPSLTHTRVLHHRQLSARDGHHLKEPNTSAAWKKV